ncbi:MAG: thioredoxin family protein [Alkalibacterium sp.]|nr:thioredoxin family protein [Alkalibacterium sp.]
MDGFKEVDTLIEATDTIQQEKLVFLFVYGEHCSVCHGVLPQIKPLIDRYSEITSIQADIEKIPSLSGEFTVFTVPAVLLFLEGKEVVRFARFIEKEKLKHQIEKILHALNG